MSNNQQCCAFHLLDVEEWNKVGVRSVRERAAIEHGMHISHFNNFGSHPRPLVVTNNKNANAKENVAPMSVCLSVCRSVGRSVGLENGGCSMNV